MQAVTRAQGSTVANAALQAMLADTSGYLTDPFSLSFQVFDTSDDAKEASPVQVYPASVGTKQVVDLVAHKLGTGRYAAVWDSSTLNVFGRFVIRWFYRFASVDTEKSWEEEFEIVALPYKGPHYCTVYDLRAEGINSSAYSDKALQAKIVLASRDIERYTGRVFIPVYKTVKLSGRGAARLQLHEPICALEDLTMQSSRYGNDPATHSDLSVYNRHLSQGLTDPDDRNNPKIEWTGVYRALFPTGQQNVEISGVFGYTEKAENFVGETPYLLRHAAKLMTVSNLSSLTATAGQATGRIIRERTREQEVEYEATRASGMSAPFTGSSALDGLLLSFKRPPYLGAA